MSKAAKSLGARARADHPKKLSLATPRPRRSPVVDPPAPARPRSRPRSNGRASSTSSHADSSLPAPATVPASSEIATADLRPPSHLAKCTSCGKGVTFAPLPSGHGFRIEAWHGFDQETSFGVGDNGFPVCPVKGHGEMQTWDEELVPAREAIRQAAAKVNGNGSQPTLFDTTKPFNFEGAWMDIERQQTVVDDLAARHKEDAERAKGSKKLLDTARETLGRMVHTYRDRRVAKAKQLADARERAEAAAEPVDVVMPPADGQPESGAGATA